MTSEEKARKDASEAAASAENRAAGTLDSKEHPEEPVRLYAKSSVIYANAKDAQILRMGQLPSVARGRKPLGPIRKGRPIGIPVVRGFDHKAYAKLHPTKKSVVATKARAGAVASQSGVAMTSGERDACTACLDEEDRPTVTDLVLVIHGYETVAIRAVVVLTCLQHWSKIIGTSRELPLHPCHKCFPSSNER